MTLEHAIIINQRRGEYRKVNGDRRLCLLRQYFDLEDAGKKDRVDKILKKLEYRSSKGWQKREKALKKQLGC